MKNTQDKTISVEHWIKKSIEFSKQPLQERVVIRLPDGSYSFKLVNLPQSRPR